MDTPHIPDLDELARKERAAVEAALEEMVNSGFGDLESKLPPEQSSPAPARPRQPGQLFAFF